MFGKTVTVQGQLGVIVSVSATHYGIRFMNGEVIFYLITSFRVVDPATPDSSTEGNTDGIRA